MATKTPNSSAFAARAAISQGPLMRSPDRAAARGIAVARYEPPLRALLSLRPWRTEIVIVIAYLVVTRVWALSAAKIGIQIGQIPLFLTDLTLLALLGSAVIRRPGRLLFWASSGTGAEAPGFAVWILCGLSVAYFVIAFPVYHIYAMRDFAILEYSLFFPLTYFAISDRTWAIRVSRYFVYAGVLLAILMLFQTATGIDFGFGVGGRTVFGRTIDFLGGGDLGGVLAFSLMALTAYLLFERRRRPLHLAAAILCFLALAATGTRAAFVGVALAGVVTFLLASNRYRFAFLLFVAILTGAMLLGATVPDAFPGAMLLRRFYFAIMSAMGGAQDADAAFRLARWKDAVNTWLQSPVLGVGFGRNILHRAYLGAWSPDKFNLGMPHNTFLFLLTRVGVVGFGLVVFSWVSGVVRLALVAHRSRRPDDLAAVNILVAMAGFAAFVLFFERPMNNASFWIMLAVAQRLAETSPAQAARALGHFQSAAWVPAPQQEMPAGSGPAAASPRWAARGPA
jgi:O-antigen ligase